MLTLHAMHFGLRCLPQASSKHKKLELLQET
jgi:hypothetical protein